MSTYCRARDRHAVEGDALGDPLQVRAGVAPGARADPGEQRVDHAGDRALAVGAGDVDDRVRALRVAEHLDERADAVERRRDAGLGPAVVELGLDGAQLGERLGVVLDPRGRVVGRAGDDLPAQGVGERPAARSGAGVVGPPAIASSWASSSASPSPAASLSAETEPHRSELVITLDLRLQTDIFFFFFFFKKKKKPRSAQIPARNAGRPAASRASRMNGAAVDA